MKGKTFKGKGKKIVTLLVLLALAAVIAMFGACGKANYDAGNGGIIDELGTDNGRVIVYNGNMNVNTPDIKKTVSGINAALRALGEENYSKESVNTYATDTDRSSRFVLLIKTKVYTSFMETVHEHGDVYQETLRKVEVKPSGGTGGEPVDAAELFSVLYINIFEQVPAPGFFANVWNIVKYIFIGAGYILAVVLPVGLIVFLVVLIFKLSAKLIRKKYPDFLKKNRPLTPAPAYNNYYAQGNYNPPTQSTYYPQRAPAPVVSPAKSAETEEFTEQNEE